MITEKIIDNDPGSKVDESLPPVLINSVNAEVKSDVLPRLDDADDAEEQEEEENMPEFDGDTSNPLNQTAPQTNYSQKASSSGKAEDTASSKSKSKKKSKKSSSKSKSKTSKSDESGDEGEETRSTTEDTSGKTDRKSSGTGDRYTSEDGEDPVIPDGIDEVAAVGNNAVIVAMIAGTESSSALVACDKDTKQNASKVLKKRGISKAKALWSNDGSSSGDMSSANLKTLMNDVVPDLVFVTEGSETLSEAQMDKLAKKKIDVYELPELTSPSGIKKAVEIVGQTLANGGVSGAEDNYKAYLEYHDELVKKYTDANGGITGGYDFDEDAGAPAADDTVVTLLVDGWDAGARYDDPKGYLNTSKGIATATLGYTSNPTSYYLSAGGALNNAASKTMREFEGVGIVWQFFHQLNWKFSKWEGLDTADVDLYANVSSSNRFGSCLLWYGGSDSGFGLGTDGFPAVVATSQDIADRIGKSAQSAKQPYYPYPSIHPSGSGVTVGYFTDDAEESFVQSCIGAGQVAGTTLEDGELFNIYPNPKGLVQEDSEDAVCSWTDGSLESVLETSWAYWKFRDGAESDFDDDVKSFYSTFYGYDVSSSDLKAIKAGVED